jgi:hypothetical protein
MPGQDARLHEGESVVENVEFEVGQQSPDVFHAFELLELVRMDVDHEPLEAAEVVAVESRFAQDGLPAPDFLDQWRSELPSVCVARNNDGLPFVGNNLGFAGDLTEAELFTILLNGSFAAFGVICVHNLIKRLEVITEQLGIGGKPI